MIVEIKDLSVRFSTGRAALQALDCVSFTIEPGARIGFVGESGSGKSTLANTLGRLLPTSATIEATTFAIDGQAVPQLSSRELRHLRRDAIAYIFQDPMAALDPTMAIAGQMRLILKEDDASLSGRLEGVGIRNPQRVLSSYPHQLSGGMAQRVTIAMALMRRPRLLIADEPTAALDASLKREVMDLLFARCAEIGAAVLFVSHDLPLVRHYCDRICVMYAGRIVEERETAALFANPAHPYSRALLGAEPGAAKFGERLVAIPGVPPALYEPTNQCAFAPRCPDVHVTCSRHRPEDLTVDGGCAKCLFANASELREQA
ncbi:ABC transporter ATP-binding protein [Pseudorhizobium flavum]|uniref:Oligopeptide/dipeptide ABC transporter ATP-binding protein n=1 Tax=Pseudorhizobium flavum TaxID=1335061 RepID=A0A7X0DGL8_9HYPH|nr:ABC transporter ATP-binding protein [Pseudorhizobium flavum]MBB6182299.1 oligopeptide/dipeptide ABC transporter ATP-binding protein [Pseudorhizobium flavum]CAD6629495.1 ABC transporter ATP-binding protein [Pseudorhizobium flavum]